MIIVCFGNGLGNQMFQYAFYLELKHRYPEADIKMDINYIQCNAHNGFELDRIFGIEVDAATHRQTLRISNSYPGKGIIPATIRRVYRLKKYLPRTSVHIRYQDGTVFHPEVFDLDMNRDYLLDGTWINIGYFFNVKNKLQSVFQFKTGQIDENNKRYFDEILESESVSVHIRRGDYVTSGFSLLGNNYYDMALSYLKNRVSKMKLFVFSDDLEWVANHFSFDCEYVLVKGNSGKFSFMDMYLMSRCKHNIIANSTFSFWGAFLNKNKNKIVIAPQKLDSKSANGIYMRDWIVLDNFG